MSGPLWRARIASLGAALPPDRLDNVALGAQLGLAPEWIERRTGVRSRRRLASDDPGGLTALACAAAHEALAQAARPASAIELILAATTTPDALMPGLAPRIQAALGAQPVGGAVDLGAACAGFLAALQLARGQIEAGLVQTALVIGADRPSAWLDAHDRDTQVVFADGAAAALLCAEPAASGRGLLGHAARVDGSAAQALRTDGGGAADPGGRPRLVMHGPSIFRRALSEVEAVVQAALAPLGWATADVDWWIPHQANGRISQALGRRLQIPPGRLLTHLQDVGNTAAASVPLTLHAHQRRLRPGDRIVLCGMGAGLVASAVALRW